jgi:hypothetical protein
MGDGFLTTETWLGQPVDPLLALALIPYNKHGALGYLVKRHIISKGVNDTVNLSVKIYRIFVLSEFLLERMTLHSISTKEQELVLVDKSRFYSAGPDGFLGFNIFAKKFQIPENVFFTKFHNEFLSRDGKRMAAEVAGVPDSTSTTSFSVHLPDRIKLLVSCCRAFDSALDVSSSWTFLLTESAM